MIIQTLTLLMLHGLFKLSLYWCYWCSCQEMQASEVNIHTIYYFLQDQDQVIKEPFIYKLSTLAHVSSNIYVRIQGWPLSMIFLMNCKFYRSIITYNSLENYIGWIVLPPHNILTLFCDFQLDTIYVMKLRQFIRYLRKCQPTNFMYI